MCGVEEQQTHIQFDFEYPPQLFRLTVVHTRAYAQRVLKCSLCFFSLLLFMNSICRVSLVFTVYSHSERDEKIAATTLMPFFKWILFNGVFIYESFVKRFFFFMSCLACSRRECSVLSFTLIKLF